MKSSFPKRNKRHLKINCFSMPMPTSYIAFRKIALLMRIFPSGAAL